MRRVQAPQARGAARLTAQCRQRGASKRAVSACAAASAGSSVAPLETKGDEAWTKSYYPKLADTKQDEKDWCAPLCTTPWQPGTT